MISSPPAILIIKTGALGDFCQALDPCTAVRAAFPHSAITLLTTPPFVTLAEVSGLFDHIWKLKLHPSYRVDLTVSTVRRLQRGNFDWVFDLQTSTLTKGYFLMWRLLSRSMPQWSGHVPGASHYHSNPQRNFLHSIDRYHDQLRYAGVEPHVPLNFKMLCAPLGPEILHRLRPPFVIIAPSCAPHRLDKRWPYYGDLAQKLIREGIQVVGIGTPHEHDLVTAIGVAAIGADAPEALFVNLAGATTLPQLATLATLAAGAVGNDTGPMHLMIPFLSERGCPSLVLFSASSRPALSAPRALLGGGEPCILQADDLSDLLPTTVYESLMHALRPRN